MNLHDFLKDGENWKCRFCGFVVATENGVHPESVKQRPLGLNYDLCVPDRERVLEALKELEDYNKSLMFGASLDRDTAKS